MLERRPVSVLLVLLVMIAVSEWTLAADGKTTSKGIWIEDRVSDLPELPMGPFVRLPDGKILTVDTAQNALVSGDEGKTWENRPVFADPSKYAFRPERALLVTRSGALIVAFCNAKEVANWKWDPKTSDSPDAKAPTYVVRSPDGGKTWDVPQKLHDDWTGAIRDMIQLRDGSVVFTSMMMRHKPGRHTVVTYRSTDDGRTWQRSNVIDLGGVGHHGGVTEATIEELRDGRVWMLMRTNWKTFWNAFSSDQGRTWTGFESSGIDASSAPGLLKRLASGRLILVWNRYFPEGKTEFPLSGGDNQYSEVPVSNHRLELSIKLSDDDGKTWSKPVVIARTKKGSIAYPYLFEIRPGELWITTMQGGLRVKLNEKDFVDSLWQTDFEAAKAKAKADKKLLLVDFTGSDWCGWCIKLKGEVFDKDVFKTEAPKRFVLVELDYPRKKKLPDELKSQNDKLAKEYKVRGFPTILMLDAEGQVIARTGYRPDGPEPYVKHLGEMVSVYETIPTMRADLKKAQGLDRVKLLDQLVEAYVKLNNEIDEIEPWSKEIVSLDPQNKTGLKIKYEFRLLISESTKLKAERKYAEAKAVLDKVVALPGLSGQQKLDAYFAQGECFFYEKDFSGVVASLKKAVAANPEGERVKQIQDMITRFTPMAEAQEAVAKIKAELEKAKGVDRAKLLDQLIGALGKIGNRIGDKDQSEEIEKWSREIPTLDADNKAGLKSKYEFRSLLADAVRLRTTDKFTEAHAALDKALALPGLKGEQVQEASLRKADFYLIRQEPQKALDCLKKALAAAPDGRQAEFVKFMIRRAEGELEKQKPKASPKEPAPKKEPAK